MIKRRFWRAVKYLLSFVYLLITNAFALSGIESYLGSGLTSAFVVGLGKIFV